jgi:signal transduction histidine kinase/ligand-binding sensor domain-containing protein
LRYYALLLAFSFRALADDGATPVKNLQSEYIVDSWQAEDGLPDNFINEIARTPDGYLWIATFNGLARFNGTDFVVFDPANTPQLESRRISELYVDLQGRLWIKAEEGALACWWHGKFTDYTQRDWPAHTRRITHEDANGTLWLGFSYDATRGYRLVGNAFKAENLGRTFVERFGWLSDIAGRSWNVYSNCLCCLDDRDPVVAPIPDYVPYGMRLASARDGGVWIISNRIRKYSQRHWTDCGAIPVGTDLFNGYFEDSQGRLWVGTDVGEIWRASTNGTIQRFKIPGAATSQLGRGLCQDAEGNIWLGTGGSGMFRLKPKVFHVYSSHDGLASDLVRSVTQDRAGHIYFATVNRVDWLPSPTDDRAQNRSLRIIWPWEVLGASDGSLYVGTFGEGLFRLRATDGALRQFNNHGHVDAPINAVFEERDGKIDLGTPRGLCRLADGRLTDVARPPGMGEIDVRAISEDSVGHLYLGLKSGGLLRTARPGWEHFAAGQSLPENHIRALWVDKENKVWIGTQGSGLSRFDGSNFFNFKGSGGSDDPGAELPRTITAIIEDDEGFLWLASNHGLFRVRRDPLNRVADGGTADLTVYHFDRSDGMGSSECIDDHQPSAWKSSDGRLWFATTYGVSVVDPSSLPFNDLPPQVVIEEALIDDRRAWPRPGDDSDSSPIELSVPPDGARLEFHFTALSLSAPARNRFKFQLEGFDRTWEEAGTRRTAFYKRVPPGHYTFKVIASNNDGVWNKKAALLAVIVIPPWWQTTWFRSLAATFAGLVILGSYRWRVITLQRQTAAQQEFSRRLIDSQEQERQRIAAELHDSLGQSLLVIKSRVLLALRAPDIPPPVAAELDALTAMASGAISEARQIAHNLRPFQLDELGLTRAIRGMITNVSRAAGIPVTHELAEVDGAFQRDQEINVYRIVQELLNNIMKHSHATEAWVTLQRDAAQVRLTVRDNGRGFDFAGNAATGFGMRGLAERVRIMNGEWKVQSSGSNGTVAEASFPVIESPKGGDPGKNP